MGIRHAGAFSASVALLSVLVLGSAAGTAAAGPLPASAVGASAPTVRPDDRVIVYYQKQFADGTGAYISPLPLVTENTRVDVVNLAAVHMNSDVLNLNDLPPDSPEYTRMWSDLAAVQASGVAVIGMIGGAQNETWTNLESDYDTQYPRLRAFVQQYGLDGIDLDVETPTDLDVAIAVIRDLTTDFGDDFLITLSPVTAGILGEPNLSGFDYDELYAAEGDRIDWFNTQFYCGWGDPTAENYDALASYQATTGAGIPASKIVMAVLTNPANCDDGWVPLDELTATLQEVRAAHPDFGGVAGWEYFNSLPGGPEAPWRWASVMRATLDAPLPTPTPTVSPDPGPTGTPAPATPAASGGAGADPALAATGAEPLPMLPVVAVMLLGGSALVLTRIRRRRARGTAQCAERHTR